MDTAPDDPNDPNQLYRITVPPADTPIRLSELMADNRTGITDEFGDRDDWLEIVNTGSNNVSLGGLALTLDYFTPSNAWYFPGNLTLAGGARLVIFCDGQNFVGAAPHTSFKLRRTGDRVFLIRSNDWVALDALSYGALPADVTFGIVGNTTNAQMLLWPTPGAANIPLPATARTGPAIPQVFFCVQQPIPNGGRYLGLRWFGETNQFWRLEWSTNLQSWQPCLLQPANLGEGAFNYAEPILTESRRFLRVKPITP
jgi:hypothetical protein